MSIGETNLTGTEAASMIADKIRNPSRDLTFGHFVVARIIEVAHYGDGLPVVRFETVNGEVAAIQFSPDETLFSTSAMDEDGTPIFEK